MNEKAIQDAYKMFKSRGYNGSIDDYKQLISTNGNALNDSYKIFKGGVPEQIGGGLAVVNTGIGLTVTTDGMVSLLQPLSTYQAL